MRQPPKKIIFVTGTDTGVGKTLFSALLLHHLRESGCQALAMKPVCSGGRADVELLQSLQPDELSDDEANPFYFEEPVAPLVSLQKQRRKIHLNDVVKKILSVEKKCERLVIEGSGGLLVPLGGDFLVVDLVAQLDPQVIVVGHNRLGTINHTLLTVESLSARGLRQISVVLMNGKKADYSAQTNRKILSGLIGFPVFALPFLGRNPAQTAAVKNSAKKMKKILARILK